MSTTAVTGASAGVTSRNRVTWRDLVWVSWRQHRGMLLGTGALVLVGAALMAVDGLLIAGYGTSELSIPLFGTLDKLAVLLADCLLLYPAVLAVFWAAPLVAREYDQRTHLLAWSQDVSASRWLAGKALALGAVAVAFALLLGALGRYLVGSVVATADERYGGFNPFSSPFFADDPLVQLGYALFALALGLALSALVRRTLASMGLAAVLFVLVRALIGGLARPYYQPPVRVTGSLESTDSASPPDGALRVDYGYLTRSGEAVDYPHACATAQSSGGFDDCLRRSGIVRQYADFQPADRLATFQVIEFGVFAVLTAVLVFVTWRLVRRTTRL